MFVYSILSKWVKMCFYHRVAFTGIHGERVWGVARCCLPRSPGQPQHRKYQNWIWWVKVSTECDVWYCDSECNSCELTGLACVDVRSGTLGRNCSAWRTELALVLTCLATSCTSSGPSFLLHLRQWWSESSPLMLVDPAFQRFVSLPGDLIMFSACLFVHLSVRPSICLSTTKLSRYFENEWTDFDANRHKWSAVQGREVTNFGSHILQ